MNKDIRLVDDLVKDVASVVSEEPIPFVLYVLHSKRTSKSLKVVNLHLKFI